MPSIGDASLIAHLGSLFTIPLSRYSRIWKSPTYHKIPIYPIFYLPKEDYRCLEPRVRFMLQSRLGEGV